MRKILLALAFFTVALLTTSLAQAQNSPPPVVTGNVTADDLLAAQEKGVIVKPTSKIVTALKTLIELGVLPDVAEELTWYQYKGLWYGFFFPAEFGVNVTVVFKPNGDFVYSEVL